jgi:AraC-like DNA-binding protein
LSNVVYTEVPPSQPLRSAVRCFWSVEGDIGPRTVINRVLPDGCIDIIWDDGLAHRGVARGTVVGTMRRALVVHHSGRVDVIGVRFQPGGATSLLGVPAPELTDGSADLSLFWPGADALDEGVARVGAADPFDGPSVVAAGMDGRPAAGGFAGQGALGRAARWRLRVRSSLIETALLARASRATEPDAMVTAVAGRIEDTGGRVSVADLVDMSGVSARTLTRRFQCAVGVTPKFACRVARMQSAAEMIRRGTRSLSRLALTAGYYDQSHLNHDFAELAAITPADYARERADGFLQD